MKVTRRRFVQASAAALAGPATARAVISATAKADVSEGETRVRSAASGPGFDPWLEVDPAAIRHNVTEISRVAGGRPILAVVKNNAYGLGLETVAPVLDQLDKLAGCAVVTAEAALTLRDAGLRRPILVMGHVSDDTAAALVSHDIQLSPFQAGDGERLAAIARQLETRIPVHLYLDTGLSRLGMPFRKAIPWIEDMAARSELQIQGTFMGFTEVDDYDPVQLQRLELVAREAQALGIDVGLLHAASSHALFYRPDSFLDMVRPGLVLYGAYPAGARDAGVMDLRPAFGLKAGVVRVERLETGDSVSYDRNYIAERPVWVATLPLGHADGYPRRAVDGCEVLIDGNLYPVIGAVSASHTIVEVGDHKRFEIGAEATLVGSGHPAVHPNTVAERAGISVYDALMHLSARLPKQVV
jgi:alanine racemase